jgi:hypothetical protein
MQTDALLLTHFPAATGRIKSAQAPTGFINQICGTKIDLIFLPGTEKDGTTH